MLKCCPIDDDDDDVVFVEQHGWVAKQGGGGTRMYVSRDDINNIYVSLGLVQYDTLQNTLESGFKRTTLASRVELAYVDCIQFNSNPILQWISVEL